MQKSICTVRYGHCYRVLVIGWSKIIHLELFFCSVRLCASGRGINGEFPNCGLQCVLKVTMLYSGQYFLFCEFPNFEEIWQFISNQVRSSFEWTKPKILMAKYNLKDLNRYKPLRASESLKHVKYNDWMNLALWRAVGNVVKYFRIWCRNHTIIIVKSKLHACPFDK